MYFVSPLSFCVLFVCFFDSFVGIVIVLTSVGIFNRNWRHLAGEKGKFFSDFRQRKIHGILVCTYLCSVKFSGPIVLSVDLRVPSGTYHQRDDVTNGTRYTAIVVASNPCIRAYIAVNGLNLVRSSRGLFFVDKKACDHLSKHYYTFLQQLN